jgi:hypothetical protein
MNAETDIKNNLLAWFINGEVGRSSKVMAAVALDIPGQCGRCWPVDPDDLNRCLLLLERVPAVRGAFPRLAQLSPQWSALIASWDELAARFVAEVGLDWCRGTRAPDTYRLMRRILAVEPAKPDFDWRRPAPKDLMARLKPKPKPKPAPEPVPEPVPEPSAGKKTRPGRRRIQWSTAEIAKMINDDGYRLSDCARKIGVSTTCLILGLKRHNLKYLSKEIKVVPIKKVKS